MSTAETSDPTNPDSCRVLHFDSILKEDDLVVLDRLWHSYGTRPRPRTVRRVPGPSRDPRPGHKSAMGYGFSPNVGARADANRNFLKTGGRAGAHESQWVMQARTGYFRDEYAHGEKVAPRAETLLGNEALADAARDLYGLPVVVPYTAYGNLLVPGQELGLHTDVPAFRGADRTEFPLWFLVVMRHSGLFERWRIPVATSVVFMGGCSGGGEFVYYPDGPAGQALQIDPDQGSAVVIDADTVFHGVDRVPGDDSAMRAMRQGWRKRLVNEGDRRWAVVLDAGEQDQEPASGSRFEYGSDELRFSASWKAYCFADEDDRSVWADHADDLPAGVIMESLLNELCDRGALTSEDHGLTDTELAFLMIDTFVQFPVVAPRTGAASGASSMPSR